MSNKNRTSRTQFRAVRMPVEIDDAIARAAERLGVSRSQLIIDAVLRYLVLLDLPENPEEGGRD